ncbi:MAG: hypothetical protein J7513_00445 [Solirubrobacteraceae bacterium]|nr:hypothetical protein [Solirubrobacteraceae bacterium]
MNDTEADIPIGDGDELLVLDRVAHTATYYLREPRSHEVVAHPLLAPAAAVISHWRGAIALHAGAFVSGGKAWLVLGDRGFGKSTLLAELSLAGTPVLADDLIVVEGGDAHMGPGSIDLREPHRPGLPLVDLGEIATRRRLRLPAGEAPARAPLGGVLQLGWSDPGEAPTLEPVPPADRAPAIADARSLSLPLSDPFALLDLAALPAYTFRRPKDLAAIDGATAFLQDALK